MSPASSDCNIGTVLGGTYRLTRLLGQGGMGRVYEAVQVRLQGKRFAVKILLPGASEDPVMFARFRREARIATELGHPHIVEVLDFNETGEGLPYMVMEYLEGADLLAHLAREGRLGRDTVVRIMDQVGSALQAVHDLDIVHRDLKPENIFLESSRGAGVHVKLLDFGLSKIKHSKSMLTRDHAIFGTPFYMSPEQAEGLVEDIDHTADIFALGVIAYQCLSGTVPFDGPSPPGILYQVCHSRPRPLTELVPELPPEIDGVLSGALAKNKRDRYQRVDELVRDLRRVLTGREHLVGEHGDQVSQRSGRSGGRPGAGGGPPVSGREISGEITPRIALVSVERAGQSSPKPPSMDSGDKTLILHAGTGRARGIMVAALAAGGLFLGVTVALLVIHWESPIPYIEEQAPPVAMNSGAPGPGSGTASRRGTGGSVGQRAETQAPPLDSSSATIRILLRIEPHGARVFLDGLLQTDNPLVLAPTGRTTRLRVEADGYLPQEQPLVADHGRTIQLTLVREPAARATDTGHPAGVRVRVRKVRRTPASRRRGRRAPARVRGAHKPGGAVSGAGGTVEPKPPVKKGREIRYDDL